MSKRSSDIQRSSGRRIGTIPWPWSDLFRMSPAYCRPFFIYLAVSAGVQEDAVSPAVLFQHKDFGFEMIAFDDALFFQSPDQTLDGMSNLPLVGQTKADQIRPCHFNNQRATSSLAVQAKIRVIPSPGFGIFNIHGMGK
jgi:hypothetical protein